MNHSTGPMFSNDRRGLIQLIIIIIIGVIVLGFFGFNLRGIIESPTVHDNLVYLWSLAQSLWDNYLSGPVLWFWDAVGKPLWSTLMAIIDGNDKVPHIDSAGIRGL